MVQLIWNIAVDTALFGVMALGLSLQVRLERFLNFGFYSIVVFAPYCCWYLKSFAAQFDVLQSYPGFLFVLGGGILAGGALAYGFNRFLFEQLRINQTSPALRMLCSIGIMVVIENLIGITSGSETRIIRLGSEGYPLTISLGEAHTLRVIGTQIATIFAMAIVFGAAFFLLQCTNWGCLYRAVCDNPPLARIHNVRVRLITSSVHAISGLIAALAGVLLGLDTDLSPTMSFRPMLYVIAATSLCGLNTLRSLLLGAVGVATVRNVCGFFFDTQWQDAAVFALLLVVLIWRQKLGDE